MNAFGSFTGPVRVALGTSPFDPRRGPRFITLGSKRLRCWKTEDGGTVCSNFMYYSPSCPESPPVTETEVLPTPPEASGAT